MFSNVSAHHTPQCNTCHSRLLHVFSIDAKNYLKLNKKSIQSIHKSSLILPELMGAVCSIAIVKTEPWYQNTLLMTTVHSVIKPNSLPTTSLHYSCNTFLRSWTYCNHQNPFKTLFQPAIFCMYPLNHVFIHTCILCFICIHLHYLHMCKMLHNVLNSFVFFKI